MQSRALSALVAHMAGQSDALTDLATSSSSSSSSSCSISTKGSAARLKLQKELGSRSGVFFDKVYEAAVRRTKGPCVAPSSGRESGVRDDAVHGARRDFRDHRTWGLIQWQLSQAFDVLATDQVAGAKDVIALLMVMVDQIMLDSGSPDLGWLLTLQPDPPAPLCTAPINTPGSSLRSCSHLSDPKWIATSVSYIKEMETLSTRRTEAAKKAPPSTPNPAVAKEQPVLSRKQQRAKLCSERKTTAAAAPKA